LKICKGTESAVKAQVASVQAAALDTVRQVLPLLERNMQALGLLERVHRLIDSPTLHPVIAAV
jgi:hypothetical protein